MNSKYQLNWYGAFADQSGYAYLTRNMLIALDRLGVKIALKELSTWSGELTPLPFDESSRLQRMINTPAFPNAPLVIQQKEQPDIPPHTGDVYIYSLFETDQIPQEWVPGFRKAKKVFCFSEFNKKHWLKQIDNVEKIGFGIKRSFFEIAASQDGIFKEQKTEILNKKGYAFLSVGDFVERKGFDILLQAYCEEFKANEDVTLILKTHKGGFVSPHKHNLMLQIRDMLKAYPNHPQVLVYQDKVDYLDMARLYNACDCFVLATRGEGLCLPAAEAMTCGLPVVITGWGGHTDFVGNSNGRLVDYKTETINDIEYIKKCPHALNHKWAVPDKDHLKNCLRWSYEDREMGIDKGLQGKQSISRYTWNDMAVDLLGKIFK